MEEQHSPALTHQQLAAIGMTPNDIRARLLSGDLRRIRRGSYCESPKEQSRVARHVELIHACLPGTHSGSVVSHASAAVLHGLPVPTSHLSKVWMTRRSPGHGDGGALLTVRATPLHESEVTRIDGIAVTTLARTAADLARTAPHGWGVIVCDAALAMGLSRQELTVTLEGHSRLRGIVRARTIVEFADPRSESPAESMSRANMARAGVAAPELQFEIHDNNGEFIARTDFCWPALLLVGEVDGLVKYNDLLTPDQAVGSVFMAEKRREEMIRQQGFWVVRWDWGIASDHRRLGQLLRRAMAAQSRNLPSKQRNANPNF